MKLQRSLLVLGICSSMLTLSACSRDNLQLTKLATYQSGIFDGSAAEIVSYASQSDNFYVVNAAENSVDVLEWSQNAFSKSTSLDISSALEGGEPNSVDTFGNLIAVAVANSATQSTGVIALYQSSEQGIELKQTFEAGALPDMVTFSPDGRYLISANEGEPNDDYSLDPEGSITWVDLKKGLSKQIRLSHLQAGTLRQSGVRLPRVGKTYSTTPAQDLEPEYISIDPNSDKAYVVFQENNAIAVIDLESAKLETLFGLGTKDFSLPENAFDASDKDKAVNLKNWPVKGFYQPDSIATYQVNGKTYIVTANEGDGREYGDEDNGPFYTDEARVSKLKLSEELRSVSNIQDKNQLGRLKVMTDMGDADQDGIYEALFTYGSRSFSIFDANGNRVFDSGNDFESITSERYDINFNNDNDENDGDGRSDAKGPEPEALALGEVDGNTYAFIGLERMGGIMVYDITSPRNAQFVTYVNDREGSFEKDFEALAEAGKTDQIPDLGPEGIDFIAAEHSPTGKPMIVVASEVSGTTTLYEIQ